ncbi:MAG: MarR family transcriptional regulator [Deltaproteobacteria bacterium]|nr:MarR family transcriptional regulator [Deltaproteobacteria bacterium]
MEFSKEEHFIEEFGLLIEKFGATRMSGRVLGWLTIAEPKHQNMGQLVEVLKAAKSSVSTALKFLVQIHLVEKCSIPGERTDYYRLKEGVWSGVFDLAMYKILKMRELADRGLTLLEELNPERLEALREMRDIYGFLEEQFPILIKQWEDNYPGR